MSDESIAALIERLVTEGRAFRDAGADPDRAQVRDADTVERYLQ